MHQQTQNEDNLKPWKPSVLSIYTRDIAELPEVYPYEMVQNVPSDAVEPVDKYIRSMLTYTRFHPSEASEWLLEDIELFESQGLYNKGVGEYVDIDELVDELSRYLEAW